MNHQGQDFSEYSAEFSMAAEHLYWHWDKQAAVSVWAAAFPAAEPADWDNT